jgi:hypothetical protein
MKDRAKLEDQYPGLSEFGNRFTEFLLPGCSDVLIAVGYNRIVYGDHGPYVEFEESNFRVSLYSKFNRSPPPDAYYEWMWFSADSRIKVYRQLRDVKDLPNPPSPGFKGNRIEGYADYLPGKYYISPNELWINNWNLERAD